MYIVTAIDPNHGPVMDLLLTNSPVRGVITENQDPNEARDYNRAQRQIDTWIVHNEQDLPNVVDFMTTNFVGRDISVFALQSVSVRAPGEVRTKSVTKDGILPE